MTWETEYCASCAEPYLEVWCDAPHEHDAYCVSISDIRSLHCGCTAHKECQKSGGGCLEHGGPWTGTEEDNDWWWS